jgi:hypothetical protein
MHPFDLSHILEREANVTAAEPSMGDLPSDGSASYVLGRDSEQGGHLGAGQVARVLDHLDQPAASLCSEREPAPDETRLYLSVRPLLSRSAASPSVSRSGPSAASELAMIGWPPCEVGWWRLLA